MSDQTLGSRLKRAIEDAGTNQRQLALTMGVRPATVGDWVKDRAAPGAEHLVAIQDATGVDLHWLLTGQVSTGTEAEARAFRQMMEIGLGVMGATEESDQGMDPAKLARHLSVNADQMRAFRAQMEERDRAAAEDDGKSEAG